MLVPTIEIRENSLIRYSFKRMLEREFDLSIPEDDVSRLELAKSCIEIYETEQEFYEKTGWKRDNPEAAGFPYLKEQRICRKIEGKIWYFSELRYEEGVKEMMQPKCDQNTIELHLQRY